MSVLQKLLNGVLRVTVRPILYTVPFNHLSMALPRTIINGIAIINLNELKSSFINFCVDDVCCEWVQNKYEIDDKSKCRVVLYMHGGGFIAGSPRTHRQITSRLAKYGKARVLAFDYRKSPEHKYPAPQIDAIKVYKWLLSEGYVPENISFAGDSAGGNLAVTTAIMLRDMGMPLPSSIALMSPWLDLSSSGVSHTDNIWIDPYIPQSRFDEASKLYTDLDLRDPRVSPVFANLAGLPPILIHISDNEVLLSDSEIFTKKAIEQGVDITYTPYPDCCHVWQFFVGANLLPEAVQSIREISEFQRKHWKDKL